MPVYFLIETYGVLQAVGITSIKALHHEVAHARCRRRFCTAPSHG